MLDQLEQLVDMNELYQQISVEEMTYYNAPSGGHGAIWQAMFAMDELSQVTMENLASTTQTMAVTAGEHTMRYPDSTDTMLAPVKVELPWSRGHFNDFEWPVKFGVLPGAPPSVNEEGVLVDRITTPSATMVIDDPLERRGPFDTLFGYNYVVRQCPVPTQPSPNSRVLTGGGGAIPLGSGEGVTRICPDPPGWDVVGYRTYGTHDALVSTSFVLNYNESTGWNEYGDARRIGLIDWHLYRHMPDTRLDVYVRTMADAKLDYLWPPPNEDGEVVEAGEDVTLQGVIDPEWITDFSEALRVTGSREGRRSVRGVAYFVYEIKSLYPPSHGSFMSPGTWAPVLDNGRRQPRISWRSRWTDPNQWDADPSVTRVHPYGWMDEYPIEVHYDADLGITRSFDDEGLPVAVTIYRVDHFYFAGINVGERELIPNCYAGFNRDTSAAPAPLHLHPDQINASAESRRDYLTFLSVTRGSDRARNWSSGFRS
ncbi:MAG: hypothetical protein MI802_02400, partial [Desulfobacterales bacterium]|nr:hypothetical protein [Desulfobacterales bacterium]